MVDMIYTTLGGVTIGLALLGWELIRWWPGRKSLMKHPAAHAAGLLPFVVAFFYGTLGTLTVMGAIGWAFDMALWASNWLGDAALWFAVGESVEQSAQGATAPLTAFGNCAVFLATVCMIAAVKFSNSSSELRRGTWCGICLGTSSSVAGMLAIPLATAINTIGQTIYAGGV